MKIMQRINMCIEQAADSVAELRSCDVRRVLESAERSGILPDVLNYIQLNRPDLINEIERIIKNEAVTI